MERMLDAICLDIEDDDPTWNVERKGSGAVEEKLTFSVMIVVSVSAGLKAETYDMQECSGRCRV